MANRNNIAIYAVDPRGLSTGEFGIDTNIGVRTDRQYLTSTMETLRALALASELIYGAPASTRDPARFAFAHLPSARAVFFDPVTATYRLVEPAASASAGVQRRMVMPFRLPNCPILP